MAVPGEIYFFFCRRFEGVGRVPANWPLLDVGEIGDS